MARISCPSAARNPFEEEDGVTTLQDDVLGLLEGAGIPTEINDKIVALVAEGERAREAAKARPERVCAFCAGLSGAPIRDAYCEACDGTRRV